MAAEVPVPDRYARVNAWVISRDTDSEVRFLASAFEGVETPGSRVLDPDGDIGHVEVELGDSVIMLSTPRQTGRRPPLTCAFMSMTWPRPSKRPSRPVRVW
ncbi:hypothetical protein [Actinomadura welshii]|uniref:hypothetical protein n=1 Tax=Actinomadura welshii TaxID=3103817 RepID=UPI000400109B|nr:hypothetical protein [Actinomadura madurae]